MAKFHLYMDEAGGFEGKIKDLKSQGVPGLIVGMLVPETEKEKIERKFAEICIARNITKKFKHANEMASKIYFPGYAQDVVSLVESIKSVKIFAVAHEEDIYADMDASIRESFAANRFINMAQSLFEHVLFLEPRFYGQTMTFEFRPNSRVYPVRNNKKNAESFESIGFSSKKGEGADGLFYVWNSDALRSYLHRQTLEYHDFQKKIGKRHWQKVETIVASQSDDPFVAIVDTLAYLLWSTDFKPLGERIRSRIDIDIAYSPEHEKYRRLVRLYLSGKLADFIPAALEEINGLKKNHYRRALDALLQKALKDIDIHSLDDLRILEERVSNYLSAGRGNWAFALRLVDNLLAAAGALPDEFRDKPDIKAMVLRLRNHKLSIHNHRGESGHAWSVYRTIQAEKPEPKSIDDLREDMALDNRLAVTAANIFAFEEGNALLKPKIAALEEALKPLAAYCGKQLADPLIGKMTGTFAQNLAFLSMRKPELFSEAERLFRNAAEQFSRSGDILRHQVNLLDLYLDHGRQSDAEAVMHAIMNQPDVNPFLQEPSKGNARGMQFVLRARLKFALAQNQGYEEWVTRCSLQNLKNWFGDAVNEHPFQFTCAYLGRMAAAVKKHQESKQYFSHALAIPLNHSPADQPTLQVLRAQILVWWAMCMAGLPARQKVVEAVEILNSLAADPELKTMLHMQPDGEPGGWFAPGWKALSPVDWNQGFEPAACEEFLRCFTFNYR